VSSGGSSGRYGDLVVIPSLRIPAEELVWKFTRSSGPGGQHANKAATRVEVRFDIARSRSLGPRQRARLLERLGAVVRVVAENERSQARNRAVVAARLRTRLGEAIKGEPRRRPTEPTVASQKRRLMAKRRRSAHKRERAAAPEDTP